MFEVGYAEHSSLSLVHTSQGLSSRSVGRGGNYGLFGSSHQPTSRRGFFQCGDIQNIVRDSLRSRRGGLHQGSQSLTFRVA